MIDHFFRASLAALAFGVALVGTAVPTSAQSSDLASGPSGVQTIFVSEGDKIEIELSLLYPTRVFFEYDAGAQLIFNQAEGETPEIISTVDNKGDVYLSVVAGISGQKISGFLVTEAGRTYNIEMVIRQKDAEQIKIVSLEAKAQADEAAAEKRHVQSTVDLPTIEWMQKSSFHDSIAHLMRGLYQGVMPDGFLLDRSPSRQTERFEGVDRKLNKRFRATNFEALTYSVTNANSDSFNPELYVDWFQPYVAVAFATDNLEPGATTDVYVLRAVPGTQTLGGVRYGR